MDLDNLVNNLPVFSLEFIACMPPYSAPNLPKMLKFSNLISKPNRSIRENIEFLFLCSYSHF